MHLVRGLFAALLVLAAAIGLAACGGDEGSTTFATIGTDLTTTTSTTIAPQPTVAPSTSKPPTTTTDARPTTTALTTTTRVVSSLSDDDASRLLIIAATALQRSTYALDTYEGEWAPLIRDGSVAACYALADGLPLKEVMRSALADTEVEEYGASEFQLALVVVQTGPSYFCPQVALEDTNDSAEKFVEAWDELTAGGFFAATIMNGTWIVGREVEPGTYRSEGGESCYWERMSSFGGTVDDIIANGLSEGGPVVVTIDASDAGFKSQRCAVWVKQD